MTFTLLEYYLQHVAVLQNVKKYDLTLVTLLHFSQSSRENATPCSASAIVFSIDLPKHPKA